MHHIFGSFSLLILEVTICQCCLNIYKWNTLRSEARAPRTREEKKKKNKKKKKKKKSNNNNNNNNNNNIQHNSTFISIQHSTSTTSTKALTTRISFWHTRTQGDRNVPMSSSSFLSSRYVCAISTWTPWPTHTQHIHTHIYIYIYLHTYTKEMHFAKLNPQIDSDWLVV